MLKRRGASNKMKNPEHESGYFEDGSDGSDVEVNVEETIVDEDRKCGSACYGLTKAIHSLDVRDSHEHLANGYEDRSNGGMSYFTVSISISLIHSHLY